MTTTATKTPAAPTYEQLVATVRELLPLARSRAEDMHEQGGDDDPYWKAADKAIENADALLDALPVH